MPIVLFGDLNSNLSAKLALNSGNSGKLNGDSSNVGEVSCRGTTSNYLDLISTFPKKPKDKNFDLSSSGFSIIPGISETIRWQL